MPILNTHLIEIVALNRQVTSQGENKDKHRQVHKQVGKYSNKYTIDFRVKFSTLTGNESAN